MGLSVALVSDMTLYAIGDIHGHLDKLRIAHDLVTADRAREGTEDAPLIHVGDLVDRGPDSAGVVAYLRNLCQSDTRAHVLKGNHDRLLAWYLEPTERRDPKLSAGLSYTSPVMGGLEALVSYGVDIRLQGADLHHAARGAVSTEDKAFLDALPLTYTHEDVFCVHAGIRPSVRFEEQTEEDLVWIRGEFHDDTRDHGALIVHGHTPVREVEHHGNRLNLDTGAAYGGPLSAVAIEGQTAYLLSNVGRIYIPEIGA